MGKYIKVGKANKIISRNTKKASKNNKFTEPRKYKTRKYKENKLKIKNEMIKKEKIENLKFSNEKLDILSSTLLEERRKLDLKNSELKLTIENMKHFNNKSKNYYKNELDKKDKKIDELKDQIEFLENMILFGLDLNN